MDAFSPEISYLNVDYVVVMEVMCENGMALRGNKNNVMPGNWLRRL